MNCLLTMILIQAVFLPLRKVGSGFSSAGGGVMGLGGGRACFGLNEPITFAVGVGGST